MGRHTFNETLLSTHFAHFIRCDLHTLSQVAYTFRVHLDQLRTPRLVLRPWSAEDAASLHPILAANQAHLGDWIPKRVSSVVPVPELARRLQGFADDFAANREWRFAILSADSTEILGEADLFTRDASGRVHYDAGDRAEIGYWLRGDATGRGLATEAAGALIEVAKTLDRIRSIEIRCNPRNTASAAVPRRLGFTLTNPGAEELQIWSLDI